MGRGCKWEMLKSVLARGVPDVCDALLGRDFARIREIDLPLKFRPESSTEMPEEFMGFADKRLPSDKALRDTGDQ